MRASHNQKCILSEANQRKQSTFAQYLTVLHKVAAREIVMERITGILLLLI